MNAIIFNTSGRPFDLVDEDEIEELVSPANVSESFTVLRTVDGTDDEIECVAYEIYGDDETPDDYPDGDPFADCLVVALAGYSFDKSGFLLHEDDVA